MSHRRLPLLLLLLAAAALATAGETLPLAAPGARTVLVIRDGWTQATWSDWGGHGILAAFVREMTGIGLPVVEASALATPAARAAWDTRIWIGRQPEVDRVLGAELDRLDDDGFIIRALPGGDVLLAGRRWWGDNWAAHDLLERVAGCRWYGPEPKFWRPEEQGIVGLFDIVPRHARIDLPADLAVVAEPSYRMRWFRFMPLHSFRLRYRDRFHHALVELIDPRRFGASHPEWFPLIDGVRAVPPPGRDHHFQPCVSNPEVVALVADAAIARFRAEPGTGSFSIGMNDTDRFCGCAPCLAIAPPSIADRQQRIAYAFFDFYNRVAARVEAAGFADRRLGCLGYAGLAVLPPGALRLHPLLVPYLTRDSAQLFAADQAQEFAQTIAAWKGLAPRMGIYEYIYGGGFVVPRLYDRFLIRNVRERYGVGVDGFYAESYPNWGLDGPKYWLLARMLWDHRQDPEALLAAWYADLYGPAAGTMRRYFALLEDTWCAQALESPRSNYRWMLDARQLEVFPPAVCERAWALLEQAAREAGADPRIAARIAFGMDAFAVTRACSRRYAAAGEVERLAATSASGDDPAPALAALQAWLDAPDPQAAWTRAQAHGTALDPEVIANQGGFARFDRHPVAGAARLAEGLRDGALAGAGPTSIAAVRSRLAASLADAAPASAPAAALLDEVAGRRGLLAVGRLPAAPVIDGRIAPGEWPDAAWSGRFLRLHRLDQEAERTAVHVALSADGSTLDLAFDCAQDPASIGAAATGTDRGGWQAPAMRDDDCIALTVLAPGHGFRCIRINANGAVGFHVPAWEGVVRAAAATRGAQGWQCELALDAKALGLDPATAAAQWTLAIARYTRRAHPAARAEAPPTWSSEASTLVPAPPGEGIIGRGNHPALMTFISGARLLFAAGPGMP